MFGSKQYVEAAVQNFLEFLKKKGGCLAAKYVTPISSGYQPDIDITPELGMEDADYFHSLIGVLICIVELGRIDINMEASVLSSYVLLPREGSFQELLHVFANLKKHMNTLMMFDPSETYIDMNSFHCQDWSYSIYSSSGE